MVKLVLFDIDGTLLHTNAVGLRAFERTLEMHFKVTNGIAGLKFAGRTDTGLVREIFLKQGVELSAKTFELFFDGYAHWLAHLLVEAKGQACPGVWEWIAELRALERPPVIGLL